MKLSPDIKVTSDKTTDILDRLNDLQNMTSTFKIDESKGKKSDIKYNIISKTKPSTDNTLF